MVASPAANAPEGDGLIFEHSPQPTLLCRDDVILRANRAAGLLFDCAPEALEGSMIIELVAGPGRRTFEQQRATSGGRHVEAPLRSTASWHVASFRFSLPLPNGDVVVAIEDLTLSIDGRRQARRRGERDAELERLEQMNQFKTQLLNTAAHELNTPLTPLRLQIHLLRGENLGRLSDRQKKALEVLERNVERLSLLVSDILDVARLESGHLGLETQSLDLAELIKEATSSYEEAARGVGVKLLVEPGATLAVQADGRRIIQVLYNLLSNALKFTPSGGQVTVRYRAHGPHAVIDVTDTGLGMTKEQQARLFQPFSRVHDVEGTAIAGTGLGLYICKGIMEQHKGELTVSSPGPKKGSTFTLSVPLAATPASVRRPERRSSALVAGPLAQRLRELI